MLLCVFISYVYLE